MLLTMVELASNLVAELRELVATYLLLQGMYVRTYVYICIHVRRYAHVHKIPPTHHIWLICFVGVNVHIACENFGTALCSGCDIDFWNLHR